jgi:hypothetical protein
MKIRIKEKDGVWIIKHINPKNINKIKAKYETAMVDDEYCSKAKAIRRISQYSGIDSDHRTNLYPYCTPPPQNYSPRGKEVKKCQKQPTL